VYPDLSISCDPRDKRNIRTIQHPTVIIEILSPGIEAKDRGLKFAYYRACQSVKEYVMVDSQRLKSEICRREGNSWTFDIPGPGDTLVLTSLGSKVPVDEIYRNTGLIPMNWKKTDAEPC
jgi:Uma2 family endonuclease